MFSIPFISTQLFKAKSQAELEKFIEPVFGLTAYNARQWQAVTRRDLETDEVKFRLIRTMFELQDNYEGVGTEIIRSLEDWTEGTIIFRDFDVESQEFYQRYYALLGFLIFGDLKFRSQVYLLGSRFLVLACVWGVPTYRNVQNFFANFNNVKFLDAHSLAFAEAIALNKTHLGKEKTTVRTVQEWVALFNQFPSEDIPNKIPNFLAESMAVRRLGKDLQGYLEQILTLYYGLSLGVIWRELDYTNDGGWEPSEDDTPVKTVGENYLQILYNADHDEFMDWLRDYERASEWIWATQKSLDFVKKIIFILIKKVDLEDSEQVSLSVNFLNLLQAVGIENADKILYFDEQDNRFHWNEEYLV
jgi:hypothetical protein